MTRIRLRVSGLVAVVGMLAGPLAVGAMSPAGAAVGEAKKCSASEIAAKVDPAKCTGKNVAVPKPVKSESPAKTEKPVKTEDPEKAEKQDPETDKTKSADKNDKKKKKPLTEEEKRKEEERKKKEQEAAEAHAAAVAALAAAEADLPRVEAWYRKVTARQKAAEDRVKSVTGEVAEAKNYIARVARAAYMSGVEPAALAQVATFDAADGKSWQDAQLMLRTVGDNQAHQIDNALDVLAKANAEKAAADAEFAQGKPEYDLVRLNVAVAKFALGQGPNPLANDGGAVTDYPLPECGFDQSQMIKTTRSCTDAMKWAIAQVALPEKDWFYLCLNFVTIAYGAPQTIPRAIDHWNGLPLEARHSPNTVAPAGALMFWGPNHVALSLGNNMLISVDVLGTGRAWLVTFETIQARWKMPYLGWSYPDFRNA